MEKLIILEEFDYADEFDYPVCSVLTVDQRDTLLDCIKNVPFGSDEYGFGTNEALDFDESDIVDMLSDMQPISEDRLQILKDYGVTGIGLDIMDSVLDRLIDICNEDPELSVYYDKLIKAFK